MGLIPRMWTALALLALGVLGVLAYRLLLLPYRVLALWRAHRLPTAPFRPLLGSLPDLAAYDGSASRTRFQLALEHRARYGKVFGTCFGPFPQIEVMDYNTALTVLTSRTLYTRSSIVRRVLGVLLRNGLLLSDGEPWIHKRRLLSAAFQHHNIEAIVSSITATAANFVQDWKFRVDEDRKHTQLLDWDVYEDCQRLMLDISFDFVFGLMHDDLGIKEALKDAILHLLDDGLLTLHCQSFLTLLPGLGRLSNSKVDKVRELVWSLVESQNKEGEDSKSDKNWFSVTDVLKGGKMTKNEMIDEIITFLSAGFETSGNFLTWCLYLLSQHPEIKEKCCQEIDSTFSKFDGQELDYGSFQELTYVEKVVHETLRLYPSAPFVEREASQDTLLNGVPIPKGTLINIHIWSIQHDEDYWEKPFDFNPERTQAVAYLPFSKGSMRCIGEKLAVLEAKICIAYILRNFDFTLVENQEVIPMIRVTTQPKYGLLLKVKHRVKER